MPLFRQKIGELGPEFAGGKISQPPDFIQRLVSRPGGHHGFHAREISGRRRVLSCQESGAKDARTSRRFATPRRPNRAKRLECARFIHWRNNYLAAAVVSFSFTATAPLPMRLRR